MIFVLSFHDVKFYFLISYTSNALIDGAGIPLSQEKVLLNVSKIEPIRENAVTNGPSIGSRPFGNQAQVLRGGLESEIFSYAYRTLKI